MSDGLRYLNGARARVETPKPACERRAPRDARPESMRERFTSLPLRASCPPCAVRLAPAQRKRVPSGSGPRTGRASGVTTGPT